MSRPHRWKLTTETGLTRTWDCKNCGKSVTLKPGELPKHMYPDSTCMSHTLQMIYEEDGHG